MMKLQTRNSAPAPLLALVMLGFIVGSTPLQAAIPPSPKLPVMFAKGDIFAADSLEKNQLFKWELRQTHSKNGDVFTSTWRAPSTGGATYAIETTELSTSGELQHYGINQLQTQESGAVNVVGNKAIFSWVESGKAHTSEEEITDGFVAPSTIPFLIQKKWKELIAGEKVKMRLAVLPWRETVGFYLKKVKGGGFNEAELELTPTSPILSIFSPNIGFTINTQTKRIIRFHGPSLAKARIAGKWKDVDVRASYRYLR